MELAERMHAGTGHLYDSGSAVLYDRGTAASGSCR